MSGGDVIGIEQSNERVVRDKSGKFQKLYHDFDIDYASDFGENIQEFYVDIKKPCCIDVNALCI